MKLLLLSILLSTPAFASPTDPCEPICLKPIPKSHTITKVVEKKVYLKDPCCDAKGVKVDATAASTATTGNQTINITLPQQTQPPQVRTKVITKVYRHKVKTNIYVYRPNRFQLFLGESKTKLSAQTDDCGCNLSAKNSYKPDFGAQYLRDFGHFTGSLVGTVNGSVYLGLGFNW